MDSEIRFHPDTVRRGAADLSDAGRCMTASYREHGGDIEDLSEARPWGQDEIGQSFQTNYDQILPTLMKAWPDLAAFVEQYAAAVTYAADAAEQANAAARRRLTW